MGNNKSILIRLQEPTTSNLHQEKALNNGNTNSTSSLPVGLNKYSSVALASSPASTSSIKTTSSATNSSSAGFLKRLIRNTNNDLFSMKSKKNSIDKLNDEISTKKKKYLILPRNNNKFLINNNNKNSSNNESNANEAIKSSSSIIKFSMNEILIEPEYTSISDCNLVVNTNSSNTNKESLYESAIEIYDLIKKDNAITTTTTKKQINLDANLYSEVLSNNNNNNANKPNNSNHDTRLLLITQAIQKYNLNSLFHRFKLAKNKTKLKQQPVLPLIPAKAFNPTKEFIYEQTKLNNQDDNETNIYFKIGKTGDEEEDDEIDGLKPPDLPPKLVDYQAVAEYECMKSLLISSSSTSSSSSNSSTEPPPIPPLPDKPLLTSIEPINLNNQLYYSFVSSDGNDKYLIDNDYYSLNLANMENLINKIISFNKTDQLNSQSCTNILTATMLEEEETKTQTKSDNEDLHSDITLNSNTTSNSSPKISSCASLNSNTNINNDELLLKNIVKL